MGRGSRDPRFEVRPAFQAFIAGVLGFWPKMGRAAPNPAPARSRVLPVRRNNEFFDAVRTGEAPYEVGSSFYSTLGAIVFDPFAAKIWIPKQ